MTFVTGNRLTPQQEKAGRLVASGHLKQCQIATLLGVGTGTISNWMKEPDFKIFVEDLSNELSLAMTQAVSRKECDITAGILKEAAPLAAQKLVDITFDLDTPKVLASRTAESLLDRTGYGKSGVPGETQASQIINITQINNLSPETAKLMEKFSGVAGVIADLDAEVEDSEFYEIENES